MKTRDDYLPYTAEIVERREESRDIFTLGLKMMDAKRQEAYQFLPGQFNMLYYFGLGEVPISIVSDPNDNDLYFHTIRRVGRVTQAMSLLKVGDQIGLRGPYGNSWPLEIAKGKNVLIVTGGLGCAATVSIINYIFRRRDQFGHLTILQGVKHSEDLLYRKQYELWEKSPNTRVLLAADIAKPSWPWYTGLITELIDEIKIDYQNTICMMCGPEPMMLAAIKRLSAKGLSQEAIYLSVERNMECALGHCGHCQLADKFVCKNGSIFCYPKISAWFGKTGF